jgi:hypothetical protein
MNAIDQLIFNVTTLGQVQKNKRINTTKEFIYIEEDAVMQGVSRWYCGASRQQSVTFILKEISLLIEVSKLISESFHIVVSDVIYNNVRSMHSFRLRQIRDCLSSAISGINNLSYTYNDPNVTAKLQFIIGEIDEHLVVLNETIRGIEEVDAINGVQPLSY